MTLSWSQAMQSADLIRDGVHFHSDAPALDQIGELGMFSESIAVPDPGCVQ